MPDWLLVLLMMALIGLIDAALDLFREPETNVVQLPGQPARLDRILKRKLTWGDYYFNETRLTYHFEINGRDYLFGVASMADLLVELGNRVRPGRSYPRLQEDSTYD